MFSFFSGRKNQRAGHPFAVILAGSRSPFPLRPERGKSPRSSSRTNSLLCSSSREFRINRTDSHFLRLNPPRGTRSLTFSHIDRRLWDQTEPGCSSFRVLEPNRSAPAWATIGVPIPILGSSGFSIALCAMASLGPLTTARTTSDIVTFQATLDHTSVTLRPNTVRHSHESTSAFPFTQKSTLDLTSPLFSF